jgi:glycosyltransferase involved in cell wall biosynthesis
VLFMVGIQGAPLRYRARLPAEALELLGVRSDVLHYRDPAITALAREADALVVYRVPATTQVLELVATTRQRGVPVFFDVDDLVFDPDLTAEIPALTILPQQQADLWMEGVRRYRTTMEACDVYIGSTEALCRHAEAVVGLPAERFGNGVGIRLGRLADGALSRPLSPGRLRVGYLSGTDTHDQDWHHVEPAVVRLLESRPDTELWLVGLVRPSGALDRFQGRVRRLPFQAWSALPTILRDLDVNLAPLRPESRFNDAKSAIKWLEAALSATPTVASPSQPFREVIDHGQNGMLAATEEDWTSTLQQLVDDGELRQRLGRRARRDALLRWAPHLQAVRYLQILRDGSRRRQGGSAWQPVVRDEPYISVALEPYDDRVGPTAHPTQPTRAPWRRALDR